MRQDWPGPLPPLSACSTACPAHRTGCTMGVEIPPWGRIPAGVAPCCRPHLLLRLPGACPSPLQVHPAPCPARRGPQEILASKEADHSARWLAAVHFKNSCNKYWRSRLPG